MESGSPEEEDRLASVLRAQRQVHLQQHQSQSLASPQYTHQLHRQANFDSHCDYREADFDLESDPDPYRRRSDSSSHQSHHHYLPSSPVTNAFARENLDASAAHTAGASATGGHVHDPVNPDEFYRSYRGVQSSSHHHRTPSSDTDYMATSLSRARDNPSTRPNGNAKDPTHPPAPAGRTAVRPSQRSASAPIEPPVGAPRTNTNRKPSVKDLTRRFDQQTSTPAMPRIPVQGVPIRLNRTGTNADKTTPSGNGPISYSTLRTSVNRELTPDSSRSTTSRTQRTKFVAEDQLSSNSQSFASRIAKPRNLSSTTGGAHASKSMTNLQQKSPSLPPSSPPAPGLLFGEILPEQRDTAIVGFGIAGSALRQRRTSESSLHMAKLHQRTKSDPDLVEPESPTDWYRTAKTKSNGATGYSTPALRGHVRAHSDVAASKPGVPMARKALASRPMAELEQSDRAASPTSRLPVSVRKLATPSDSTSPPSTRESSRANSPSTFKRPPPASKTNRTTTPATRSKTPTRAKTPTQATPGRKPAPRGLVTPSNNTRLAAYVAAPPPKLSPPLRSSRPRQSVSTATTASSRMKAIDRSKSPQKRVPRQSSKLDESTTRRRKISIGPIDFEQRREHIRLAYTKSIRDSQVRDARQAAARRKKDQESAAAEENEHVPPVPPIEPKAPSVDHCEPFEKPNEANPDEPESSAQPTSPQQLPQPLTILTAVPPIVSLSPPQAQPADSPTLGVPGSFPEPSPSVEREENPQSAVSATSETTEFDNEPQEMPPVQLEPSHPPTGLGLTIAQPGGNHEQAAMEEVRRTTSPENPDAEKAQPPPTPEKTAAESSDEQSTPQTVVAEEAQQSSTPEKAEYQYPFEDESAGGDDLVSIKISLDATSPQQSLEPTPTRIEFEDTSVPGAFASSRPISKEYEPVPLSSPSYETTVKILRRESEYDSPRQTIPFPRMESYDDFDDQSQLGDMDGSVCDVSYFHRNAEEEQDMGAPSIDTLEKPEDFYNDRPKDNDSSQRASTCESSDAQDDPHKTSLESQQTPDTSHSLMVPSMHVTVNRVSQQSAWTDFSVDSNEPLDHRDSAFDDVLPLPKPPYASDPTYGSGSSRDSSARQSEHYSPDFTPLDSGATQQISRATIHQLPELDTGEGFSISYLESKQALVKSGSLSRPDHEPPPVPTPKSRSLHEGRRTATSSYYADTISRSTMARSSWRESEDVSRPVSTTQSIDHMSIETREYSLGGQTPIDSIATPGKDNEGPTGKERHRLVQRRNVIRELVDTEMVFVRDMNIVEEIYKGTAEACPRLDDKTIKLVFRNTDEIISFHTTFCAQLKEAVSTVYVPHGRRSPLPKEDSIASDQAGNSSTNPATPDLGDDKDRATSIGPLFKRNIEQMRLAHEGFLRNSDHAAKRLIQIQQDPTVKVWLTECNEVAKDLTAAWDLDSLLIKPMQRITKYPTLIQELLRHTPEDHPDRAELVSAKETLELAIIEINKTKKNFELVGQIVGRKRKESDVKAGFARAFGKRVDKLQATSSKIPEDAVYAKLHEKFGDDYLRLQVVLRDVEFYTRQVSAYVHEFLQYLSAMELVMRLQPGSYPELESKWVQFNVSMRDIEKIALEDHLQQVRKHVIEPFEHVIKAYGNPSLAMKKRAKRRLDYERAEQLKKGGKTPDPRLKELVEQYDALNETLKKELPQLSALTERIGNICLGNLVNIQANWYSIWVEKVKKVTGDTGPPPDVPDIVSTFQRDYKYAQELFTNIGILNPTYKGRTSQSTTASTEDAPTKHRARPAEVSSPRGRGLSVNGDHAPMLPTPDFAKRHSGQFTLSPSSTPLSPHQFYYRDYYAGAAVQRPLVSASPVTGDQSPVPRANMPPSSARPGTGRSHEPNGLPRQSSESAANNRRDSNPAHQSQHSSIEARRFSGLFHSALPMPDGMEESQKSSRASSRERTPAGNGYNVLWLAASLFEFNIETTKHEAGYPYLTYQAGEIFDVIAEKGELWLAKNQDDPDDQVGWIWSKHFAKLADS
ncbi:Dynamin-binding protein [Colletotrichum tanaceti]|uniref:Dynamin-binding protein n=1 Tax=Colletotrichum tanaceti TaxID=1306861 RepID=A0A4U6XLN6_9PEZI|nr:Dynamin-binding protein [Colletotrichum tanaceti]TKW56559.1 Dynamin-binding protein [Colletotrichum tanaceti]